jgi:hypothetical protein
MKTHSEGSDLNIVDFALYSLMNDPDYSFPPQWGQKDRPVSIFTEQNGHTARSGGVSSAELKTTCHARSSGGR